MRKRGKGKIEKKCAICRQPFLVFACIAHRHATCGSDYCRKIYSSGKRNGRYIQEEGLRYTPSGHAMFYCAHCKKRFTLLPNRVRQHKNPPRFCSRECDRAYSHHQYGKTCTLSCIHTSMGQRAYACEICEHVFMRYPSQLKGRIFCSKECQNIGRQRRVSIYCALCGKEVKRPKGRLTAKTGQYFCGNFCKLFFYEQERRKKTIYAPEFVRSLIDDKGIGCPFPNCGESRAIATPQINPWGLCAIHANRVYSALSNKRRIRERILSAENL